MKIAIGNRVINTLQSDNPYNRLFLCVLDDMAMKLEKAENITANVISVTAMPFKPNSSRCRIQTIYIAFNYGSPGRTRTVLLSFWANFTRYRNSETEKKTIDLLQVPLHEAEKAIFDGKLLMAMASSVNEIRCLEIAAIMDGIKKVLIERKPISAVFPSTALKEGE